MSKTIAIFCWFITFFIVKYQVVHGMCNDNPNKCCVGTVWNENLKKCIACKIGYIGQFCEVPCEYPYYGGECLNKCNCTIEFCNISTGCLHTGRENDVSIEENNKTMITYFSTKSKIPLRQIIETDSLLNMKHLSSTFLPSVIQFQGRRLNVLQNCLVAFGVLLGVAFIAFGSFVLRKKFSRHQPKCKENTVYGEIKEIESITATDL